MRSNVTLSLSISRLSTACGAEVSGIDLTGPLGADRVQEIAQALGTHGILLFRRADITPANKHRLTCAWVNRPGRALGLKGFGAEHARPDLTVSTLSELVAVLT